MFSEEVNYQLDFAKKSKVYFIHGYSEEDVFDKNIHDIENILKKTDFKKISLVSAHECFYKKEYIDTLISLIENHKDKEIFISASTSTHFNKYFYNPIVNIYFYRKLVSSDSIAYKHHKYIPVFDLNLYKDLPKSIKGIISVRKETNLRNYLFSIFDFDLFDGISRYATWPPKHIGESDEVLKQSNKFPTTIELLNEYKKTYVSFVVETDTNDFMNFMTEKTFISMLTKTMPVVLGGKHYVKELKKMGFYVWNDEFGFGDGDDIETNDFRKTDKFNECINKFNQMSKTEIINMYNFNIDKIENNYNILSEILLKKQIL